MSWNYVIFKPLFLKYLNYVIPLQYNSQDEHGSFNVVNVFKKCIVMKENINKINLCQNKVVYITFILPTFVMLAKCTHSVKIDLQNVNDDWVSYVFDL